ncbi:MAG: hypothetical protein E7287_04215 [Lachnospiraceae bacterium]|nr:hypothetical protein [Lachnospiraceae bacterium]
MIKKNSIFDYAVHTMVIWGISILSICLFCALFGESAKELSTLFQLGSRGISLETLMQFLVLAIVITGLRWLFFTDTLFKRMTVLFRSIWMLTGVIVSVGVFAAIWRWFPVNQVLPWIMFIVCFLVCACISVIVSALKERSDNRRMQDALERLKSEENI